MGSDHASTDRSGHSHLLLASRVRWMRRLTWQLWNRHLLYSIQGDWWGTCRNKRITLAPVPRDAIELSSHWEMWTAGLLGTFEQLYILWLSVKYLLIVFSLHFHLRREEETSSIVFHYAGPRSFKNEPLCQFLSTKFTICKLLILTFRVFPKSRYNKIIIK